MNKKFLTVAGMVLVLGGLSFMAVLKSKQPSAPVAEISYEAVQLDAGMPSVGGPFTLVDTQGRTRTDQDFRGKPMLVYFGYTYCPDVCPMGLSSMGVVAEELKGQIQPVFVTIDPERDTPEQLALYAQNFHPDFVMLSGSKDQVDGAKKAYRVYGARASEDRGTTDYLMDHSSLIYFMDEKGQFQLHFNHQTPPDVMIKAIRAWGGKG